MRKIITLLSCLVCLQLSAQITTYNINRNSGVGFERRRDNIGKKGYKQPI